MRPIFAIAPLAILLALIGPTPHEANRMLARLKARLFPEEAAAPAQSASPAVLVKPGLKQGPQAWVATTPSPLVQISSRQ
ncbi:MAG: hypothetical protein QM742_18755 [Aquabacterium sp.]